MEDAKSSVGEIDLFTGVQEADVVHKHIVFRELSGIEEDVLASKKMSVSSKITRVLANCVQAFGTIQDRDTVNKMVRKMTIADRIFYLIQLRILSIGRDIQFVDKCPACGNEDKKDFDLNQVIMKDAPVATSLLKEVVLPSGKKVRLKVANGESEEKIEKATTDDNAATIGLFVRIDAIDDQPPSLVHVKQMSFKDRNALRKEIDALEGELDDTYKTSCPACGHEYEGDIPINGVDFFFP